MLSMIKSLRIHNCYFKNSALSRDVFRLGVWTLRKVTRWVHFLLIKSTLR